MPFIVTFQNFNSWPQSKIIPDATPKNDGVMTKEQAAKLAAVGLSVATVADLPAGAVEGQMAVVQVSPITGVPTIAVFTLDQWWLAGNPVTAVIVGPTPKITSFLPASGPPGTVVTLVGSGFSFVIAVSIGFVDCPVFAIISDTEMTVTIPDAGVPGKIRLTVSGTIVGTSTTSFIVPQSAFGALADSLGCTIRWRLNNVAFPVDPVVVGDSSGNESWANVHASPPVVPGLVSGDAFSPDGGNSFARFISGQVFLPAAGSFSLALFVKFTGAFNQSNDLGDGFPGQSRGNLNADGSLTFNLDGNAVSTAAGVITVGPRYFVVFTYDGANMKINVEAVQRAILGAVAAGWGNGVTLHYASKFEWDGAVGEIMFFPSALTLAQQAALLAAA